MIVLDVTLLDKWGRCYTVKYHTTAQRVGGPPPPGVAMAYSTYCQPPKVPGSAALGKQDRRGVCRQALPFSL